MHQIQSEEPEGTVLDPKILREAWETRYRMKGRQWGNAPIIPTEFPKEQGVLELGVGDGKNLRTREISAGQYIGLDFSHAALQICQKDPVLAKVSFVLGDARFLPFRSSSVEQVLAHHILGHIPGSYIPNIMSDIYDILVAGGTLVLTVFAAGDMRDGRGTCVEPSTFLRGDGIITRYFTPDDIRSIRGKFILQDINVISWPFQVKREVMTRSVITAIFKKPN